MTLFLLSVNVFIIVPCLTTDDLCIFTGLNTINNFFQTKLNITLRSTDGSLCTDCTLLDLSLYINVPYEDSHSHVM